MFVTPTNMPKVFGPTDPDIFPFPVHKQLVPLLRPKGNVDGIYNPGATLFRNGTPILMPRITIGEKYPDQNYVSYVGVARASHGLFVQDIEPVDVLSPDERFPWGYEDPRITQIGRTYYIVVTGYDGKVPQIVLTTTKDFCDFHKNGVIGPRGIDDKDAFLHPEKVMVNGKPKFMLYHRVSSTGNIQYVFVDSIDDFLGGRGDDLWRKEILVNNLDNHTLLRPKPDTWESRHLGGGVPPIKTPEGWLFIYHAVGDDAAYRGGIALLDLKEPWKVISRSPYPILQPTLEHEITGLVENVVFPQGAIVVNGKQQLNNPLVHIYYGAADKTIGTANFGLNDALTYLKQFNENGEVFIKTPAS